MKTPSFRRFATALILITATAASARADISFVNMFRNDVYVQTSDGAATYDSSFFTLNLFSTDPDEFTSVQAVYSGPDSPVALTQTASTIYGYSSTFLASQAVMDTAYPFGTYEFDTTGAGGPLSTSFDYSADAYPQTVPYLTGTSYSDLQGMDSTAPITFQLSTFDPDPLADNAFLFLTIFETSSGTPVYDFGFQPSTTTSLVLPANILNPDTDYTYELIFSDRVTTDSPGAEFSAQIGFDYRTSGSFVTAVPEPSTGLLMLGAGAVLLLRRRLVARRKIS